MDELYFLLSLAFILVSTKILGLVSRKVNMPQVVGALAAGLVLGPSILDIVRDSDFIRQSSEIGVIVILFLAGLETDLKEIRKSGKASLIIAMFGVLVPLVFGFGIAMLFDPGTDRVTLIKNIFIGVIITATSVSISVETLQELGVLKSKAGNAIVTAALIDDILGIILLAVITGFAGSSEGSSVLWSVLAVFGKIAAFFVFSFIVGVIFKKLFDRFSQSLNEKRRYPIIALSFCLVMAYFSEHLFGVADITGAFIAGVVLSTANHAKYIGRRVNTLAYLFLSPIFFAHVGISTNLREIDSKMLFFALSLLAAAILAKVIGCGFGSRINGFSKADSLRVGVGMSARSEVALIIASNGVAYGIMEPRIFPAVIILVVVSSVLTPMLLKMTYTRKSGARDQLAGLG